MSSSHEPSSAPPNADPFPRKETSRRSRWLVGLLGVCVVLLVGLLSLSLSFGGQFLPPEKKPSPAIVVLTSYTRIIVFLNNTTGAIIPSIGSTCGVCPIAFVAGTTLSLSLGSFQVNTTLPELAMRVTATSTIPMEPIGGWTCLPPGSCPAPAVTKSTYFEVLSPDIEGFWGLVFDPPANATSAADGPLTWSVTITTCSPDQAVWNSCP